MSLFSARNTKSSGTNSSQPASSSFLGVQAKLNIGKSDDKYEREADRMADKVVNKTGGLGTAPFIPPSPKLQKKGDDEQEVQKQEETEQIQEKPLLNEITPLVQRKEEEVQEKGEENEIQQKQEEEQVQAQSAPAEELQQKSEEEDVQTSVEEESIQQKGETEIQPKLDGDRMAERNIQRKEEEVQEKEEEVQEKEEEESLQKKSAGNGEDTSNLEQKLSSSKGGGNPMDSNTRNQMESGFGTDFSGVRIHNDANAVQMNKELGAQAFTNGNDIYFNEGKYDPSSKNGQHLLAHELTHTVQQGASNQPNVQKAAAAPVPADAPALKPTVPLDITHRLNITGEWAKYLDAEYEKKKGPIDVDVKIGERYSGTIELSRKKGTDEGELAKYEITNGTKKKFLKINGWSFLQPLRDAGIEPVLVLNKFGEEQVTTGFLSVAIKDIAVGNAKGFIDSLNENLDKMGFLGISPITIADGFVNEFSAGRLVFQVGAMKTLVDGYLEAGGGMGITGDVFTFNVNASIDVAGLASGEFMIARGEDGSFSGTADIEADIANVNAKLHVEYIDGTVTIQGTGRIQSEKFSGEITLLVTDAERSKQMMHAALGVEAMDAEKEQAEAPAAPVPKSKGNQVLAGWGEITANITPWLSGTAKVGIDAEGHVTIVGEITVPQEVELMEQRGKKVDIFKVEIRAGYGIPLVGQVFLFASIGMFMNAGFGPLVLKGVGFKGTYSTDPNVLQEFEITGTLNINAFAVLGLEAEAGVGVTILGHDIKAGVNVTAAAGLRAYAEATPTLQYKEQAAPQGGKMGETRLKGHFEAAAQLFMQLSGSLFYELDSPWWSPAPDGREDFPLGEVQYPIGDSMGIGADMDWLVGSSEIPELKFSPVEFDADKFTADVMADPPPRKMGKANEEKAGEWEDGNKPGNQQETPETKDGAGLPDTGKAKEDLKKLPDEQKYMRALDEMSKLEKADPKPTFAVVKAKSDKVKAKYGLDQIKATDKGDIGEVFVKHAKQDNKKHLLEIPMMSAAERYKLLKTAMDDLKMRNSKAGGEEGTVTESEAKELIAAWQKAHPVVEETRVVDGGATWDYFIDIGDKSETEKGKKKKEGEKDKAVDIGKEIKFKIGEENHRLWITIIGNKAVAMMASNEGPVKNQPLINNDQEVIESADQVEKEGTEVHQDQEAGESEKQEITAKNKEVVSGEEKLVTDIQEAALASNNTERDEKIKLLITSITDTNLKEFMKEKMEAQWAGSEVFRKNPTLANFILASANDVGFKKIYEKPLNKDQNVKAKPFSQMLTNLAIGKLDNDENLKKYPKGSDSQSWLEGRKGQIHQPEDRYKTALGIIKDSVFDASKVDSAISSLADGFEDHLKNGDTNVPSADEIFKEVSKVVKDETHNEKYIAQKRENAEWITVFPSKGKKIYKGADPNNTEENMLSILGGASKIMGPLKAALEIGIRQSPKIAELELDSVGLEKAVNASLQRLIQNFKETKLFYIDSTPVVRYQKGASDADSVIRTNSDYKGGYSSLYVKKAEEYATKHSGSIESKLEGQIHHNVPLYLGGSHFYRNLIAAIGQARVNDSLAEAADSAHKAMHDLIERKEDVSIRIKTHLEENQSFKNIVLQSLSPGHLASAFKGEDLNLIIGTMYDDGYVLYKDTEIKVDTLAKNSNE